MNQCVKNNPQNPYYVYCEDEPDNFHHADYCEDISVFRNRRYPEEISDFETTYPAHAQYCEPLGATEGSVGEKRNPVIVSTGYYHDHPTTYLSYQQTPIVHLLRNHTATFRSKSPLSQFRYANTFFAQTASTYPQNSIPCGFGQDPYEDYYQKYEGEEHTRRMHENKKVLHQKHDDGGFGRVVNKEDSKRRKNLATAKVHKYVSKNSFANVKKKPSVPRLPVATQPNRFLVRRRSKTYDQFQHQKRIPPEALCHQSNYNTETFSAHKMNSEGDVKSEITMEDLDSFLDNFEKNMDFQNDQDIDVKEFCKFLKLKIRVPSSVKMRHQQLKSTALAPKMKMSLNKLMDRLRTCDGQENHSQVEESNQSGSKTESITPHPKNGFQAKSFTYDSLTRKYPSNVHRKEGHSVSEPRNCNSFNNPVAKRSATNIHVMDDQKELCSEVADSIITNTSAPSTEKYRPLVDKGPDKEIRENPYMFSEDRLARKKSETNQFQHPKNKLSEALLDNFENNIAFQGGQDVNIEDISKSWNPKAPSLIHVGQEKTASRELAPKINTSTSKLLDRSQNCDIPVNPSKEEESCKSSSKEECSTFNFKNAESSNNDFLAGKYSLFQEGNEEHSASASGSRNRDSFNSFFAKRSKRIIRAMDDHYAFDLHKSKGYIVDLIDRALSKELGTVPRDDTLNHNVTPSKAIATIRLHQRTNKKELCYEVTAELTDSIIANDTAPHSHKYGTLVEGECDTEIQEQPSEETYIKQLKKLRWEHILHIQHEAKELADLEEFLEKYSDTRQ